MANSSMFATNCNYIAATTLLCRIINTSLNSGVFPTRLKYSVITIHYTKKVTKIMRLVTDQFHY